MLTAIFVLLGVLLLVVEVALIPGFGVVGIMGILSFITSVVYAFTVLGVLAGWVTLAIVVLSVVLLIISMVKKTALQDMTFRLFLRTDRLIMTTVA